jgi:uncharacterized membrane protein YcaP (DUF421 family)
MKYSAADPAARIPFNTASKGISMWIDMFGLDLPVLEKVLRAILVYAFMLIGFRLAGKRELAQLNAMDLIVILLIANTVQNSIIGDDNSVTGGVLGAATLLLLNYIVVRFLFSHPRFDRLVEGRPSVLIAHGQLNREEMQLELITRSELEAAAHRQGFGSLREVDRAVLEPSGVISFIGKEPTPTEAMRDELLARLDEINRKLAEVKAALGRS